MISFKVSGTVIEWRGPAPFFFLPTSKDVAEEIELYKRELSYGWGVVPAEVSLGSVTATTALIPRDGVFLVPLKDAIRRPNGVSVGDQISLTLRLRA